MFPLEKFVMVASLKEDDKTWRRVDLPYDDVHSVKDGITFHGRLHCRIYSYENPYRVITFDPISENFGLFPIPEPPKHKHFNCEIGGLGVLDDCLCMSRGFICDYDYGIEILVMKEYGVKKSWTSLFFIKNRCFDPHGEFAVLPITAADNGEVALLINAHKTELVVYNPKNDKMRKLFLVEYMSGCISAFTYTLNLKDTLL
ncbi:F-box protein CPR1-like [Nicotiana sylvestris]